jgi:hypothetical protein
MTKQGGAWIMTGAIVLALAAGFGCKPKNADGKKGPAAPRVETIKLAPPKARAGDKLTANTTVFNPNKGETRIELQWYLNEKKSDVEGEEFDTKGIRGGDRVSFQARAIDVASGLAGDWKTSNAVTLEAAYGPALKAVTIKPSPLYAREAATAAIDYGETDPDGVSQIYYRWSVNKQLLQVENMDEVTGETLPAKYFAIGDQVMVEVCTDGLFRDPGLWAWVTTVVNAPPIFNSTPLLDGQGKLGMLHLDVTDPDGDQMTVTVTQSPPGSEIDLTQWGVVRIDCANVPPGRYPVAIKISDGHDGELTYSTNMTVP